MNSPLELDGFDTERKLYTADSLNNLHKMNICYHLQELMSVHLSSQRNRGAGLKGEPGPSQDNPNTGVQSPVVHCGKGGAEEGCEEEEGSRTQSTRSRLLTVVFLILAIALLSSLALSSYAVYLMVQTTERLEEFSSSQVEQTYLAQIRQWKALLLQYLGASAGGRAK
ncbi:hypothetical protein SKAU_G00043190 [Synaphobranchus kaupii]|uniref:Uncharacterized protein n=1 Tax=Synaphobranchus kaupii TaxID=118154 RepID=A0A9Q1J6U7_SYNKA|nr:hypothetical protein SKAU_G00043190 [Synaphobranchus kaupii]